jgi:hypothetical protein
MHKLFDFRHTRVSVPVCILICSKMGTFYALRGNLTGYCNCFQYWGAFRLRGHVCRCECISGSSRVFDGQVTITPLPARGRWRGDTNKDDCQLLIAHARTRHFYLDLTSTGSVFSNWSRIIAFHHEKEKPRKCRPQLQRCNTPHRCKEANCTHQIRCTATYPRASFPVKKRNTEVLRIRPSLRLMAHRKMTRRRDPLSQRPLFSPNLGGLLQQL